MNEITTHWSLAGDVTGSFAYWVNLWAHLHIKRLLEEEEERLCEDTWSTMGEFRNHFLALAPQTNYLKVSMHREHEEFYLFTYLCMCAECSFIYKTFMWWLFLSHEGLLLTHQVLCIYLHNWTSNAFLWKIFLCWMISICFLLSEGFLKVIWRRKKKDEKYLEDILL